MTYKRKTISADPEYRELSKIKGRCNNPNDPLYPKYGGRGIKVCPRWLDSYYSFKADMGLRPEKGYIITLIDENDDFKPSNCKWVHKRELSTKKPTKNESGVVGVSRTSCGKYWQVVWNRKIIKTSKYLDIAIQYRFDAMDREPTDQEWIAYYKTKCERLEKNNEIR